MENIILKNSWILYLNVENNLRPTVSSFVRYGFTLEDIRTMTHKVPSVLAMDHRVTLPAKLQALEEEFGLAQDELVQILVEQPMLLTSSTGRNQEVAAFLEDVMGLSKAQIAGLLLANPKLGTAGVVVLSGAWTILIEVYGLSVHEAVRLVLKNPYILSKKMLMSHSERIILFSELGFPAPFEELQKLVRRAPNLLYYDVNYFIKRNVDFLQGDLVLDAEGMFKLVSAYPQLFCYNPRTLHTNLRRVLNLFTGTDVSVAPLEPITAQSDSSVQSKPENEDEDGSTDEDDQSSLAMDSEGNAHGDVNGHTKCVEGGGDAGDDTATSVFVHVPEVPSRLASDDVDVSTVVDVDVIASMAYQGSDLVNTAVTTAASVSSVESSLRKRQVRSAAQAELCGQALALALTPSLGLSSTEARSVVTRAPWVLSYSIERTRRLMAVLVASLAFSRAEASKLIRTYPRMLSLSSSADGKLCQVLRMLANGALRVVLAEVAAGTDLTKDINWRPIKKVKGEDGRAISGPPSASEESDSDTVSERGSKKWEAGAAGESSATPTTAKAAGDSLKGFDGLDAAGRAAVKVARRSPVRRMVREMLVRYPLAVGTRLDRIEKRLADFLSLVEMSIPVRTSPEGLHTEVGRALRWDAFVQVLRRPDDAHLRWRDRAYVDVQAAIRLSERAAAIKAQRQRQRRR